MDCLLRNSGTIKKGLKIARENHVAAQKVGEDFQKQLESHQKELKGSTRKLRDVALQVDSVAFEGAKCAQALQRLSVAFADSASKNASDSYTISSLRDEVKSLNRDHSIISEACKSMRHYASVFTSLLMQTSNDFEFVRNNTFKIIGSAVLQLGDQYQNGANALARVYVQSVPKLADRLHQFEEEQKANRKICEAAIGEKFQALGSKLESTKKILLTERLKHDECRYRCLQLDDALAAKKEEIAQLQLSAFGAEMARKEMQTERETLTLCLKDATLDLTRNKQKCEELLNTRKLAQESLSRLLAQMKQAQSTSGNTTVSIQAKLKNACQEALSSTKLLEDELQKARDDRRHSANTLEARLQRVSDDSRKIAVARDEACLETASVQAELEKVSKEVLKLKDENKGAHQLLAAKKEECIMLLKLAKDAEAAQTHFQVASGEFEVRAKKSERWAEDAKATISRLQGVSGEFEQRAKKSERRAANTEAALSRLQGVSDEFEQRAKNSEMLAKTNTNEATKKLQQENESLAGDLRRAKSLLGEAENNLEESAQLTLNALSENEKFKTDLATCQESLSKQKSDVARLTSELDVVTKNAAVNKSILLSNTAAWEVALAEGQSEILRLHADRKNRKNVLGDLKREKEQLVLEISACRDALEREKNRNSKLASEHDVLVKRTSDCESARAKEQSTIARVVSEHDSQMRNVEREKELLSHELSVIRAAVSKEKDEAKRLSSECCLQIQKAAAEKGKLLSDLRSVNAALSEEQRKTLRMSSELDALVEHARTGECTGGMGGSYHVKELENNAEKAPKVVNAPDKGDIVFSVSPHQPAARKDKKSQEVKPGEATVRAMTHKRGIEERAGGSSSFEDSAAAVSYDAPQELANVRKSLRRQSARLPSTMQSDLKVEVDLAEQNAPPTRGMKLQLAPKKQKRQGFKRPRAKVEELKGVSRVGMERNVKPLPKKAKKAAKKAAETASAAKPRLESDDDDDWMVG